MKKLSNLLAVGLSVCLCLSCMNSGVFAENENISLAAAAHIEGEGTKSSPYLITTENHLVNIANGDTSQSAYYKLENDIKLKSYDWKLIDFSGTFDGNGHTISNLKIGERGSNYSNLGLFGTNSGTIQNLDLQVAQINDGDDTDSNNNTGRFNRNKFRYY